MKMNDRDIENNKKCCDIVEFLRGEINRMCITDSVSELDNLCIYAIKNIEKLYKCRHDYLESEEKE